MQNTFYTVESMPVDKKLDFVAIDEIQMCNDHERGHIFTDRVLNLWENKLCLWDLIWKTYSLTNEKVEL